MYGCLVIARASRYLRVRERAGAENWKAAETEGGEEVMTPGALVGVVVAIVISICAAFYVVRKPK